jgi:probable phosphoglycerate mutase
VELLIIRHALPVRRELAEGAADPELSTAGREQAELLARYLATERLDAVYASPLTRAVETAAPLAAAVGLEVQLADDVAEWDRNSPEYVPVEELKAANDPRWQAMLDGVWESDESETEFHDRVVGAVEGIVADHRGERVAIVCHGGVINVYAAHVLGIELQGPGFFYPNYTSINRVAAASSGERAIVTLNETAHLRGSGLPMGLFQGVA